MLLTVKSWGLLELLRRFSITWYLSFCYFSCIIYFILNHIELSVSQQTLLNWQNLIGFSIDDVSTLSWFSFPFAVLLKHWSSWSFKASWIIQQSNKIGFETWRPPRIFGTGQHCLWTFFYQILFPFKETVEFICQCLANFHSFINLRPHKEFIIKLLFFEVWSFLLFPYLNFYVIDNAIRWSICIFLSILLESSIHDLIFWTMLWGCGI